MPRKSSCSVWQKRTAHDTSCDDDDGGWKEANRESWRPKQFNQTQFKLRPSNPIRATVSQLATKSLVVGVDNSRTCYLQGECPILLSRTPPGSMFAFWPEIMGGL